MHGVVMGRHWIYAVQIVLSIVVTCWFVLGCEVPSAISPLGSEYPADIRAHVTIAEKIVFEGKTGERERSVLGDRVWWIVDVSVKNKDYEKPITETWNESLSMPIGEEHWIWSIIIDGKVWSGLENLNIFSPEPMSVSKGQTGMTTFLFEAPNINPSDAQLCYRGQEPYSYCELIGGVKVVAYHWNLKKEVPSKELYVIAGFIEEDRYIDLTTVETWRGSSSKTMKFSLKKAPAVVNYGSTQTSEIGVVFQVSVITEVTAPHEIAELNTWKNWLALWGAQVWEEGGKTFVSWSGFHATVGSLAGVGSIQIMEPGEVTIDVSASGCDWWVKVGVE